MVPMRFAYLVRRCTFCISESKARGLHFFPMVNLWFLNQHATNPVDNSFVSFWLKPFTHNESPYRANFSQSKSFFITVSTDITIQNVWHNYPMNRFIFNPNISHSQHFLFFQIRPHDYVRRALEESK